MDRATLLAAMAATPLQIVAVEVKGWGTLHVRELCVADVERLRTAQRKAGDDEVTALASTAAAVICDEEGVPLFDHASADDVALLAKQGFNRLSKVLAAAKRAADGDDEPDEGNA